MDWDMKNPSKIFRAHKKYIQKLQKIDLALENDKNIPKTRKLPKFSNDCLNIFRNFAL